MTTTAPPPASYSPDPPPASSSFTNRLRRLSQLRPHSNQTDRSRSYRNRLSWVVGLSQSPPTALLLDDPDPGDQQQQPQHQQQQQHQQQPSRYTSTSEQNLAELQFRAQRDSYISRSDGSGSESPTSEVLSNSSSTSSRSSQGHNIADSLPSGEMARVRDTSTSNAERLPASSSINSVSAQPQPQPSQQQRQQQPTTTPGGQSSSLAMTGSENGNSTTPQGSTRPSPKPRQLATIRFFAYQDPHQNARPSLPFAPMTRTLPDEACVVKVGRFSERDGTPVTDPAEPSSAPVGFKSKVVSRKHCEFSLVGGQWHVKDVGSSSGTFLNHMRLSQPNMSSRHYAVRDGDIVQLGIDFRGGEEMIFRSVRIRIECNRMWQQRPNEFNKNTESLINNLGKGASGDYSGCRECSICLGSVLRPYQCLFMAACAHVWHYKCIRRLIHSPEYPMFQCPNCRAYTDLNAEVDDSTDIFDDQASKEPEPDTPDQPVVEPEAALNSSTDMNADDSTDNNEREPSSNTQRSSETDMIASATDNLRINDSESHEQEHEQEQEREHELQQVTAANEPIPPSQPSEPIPSIGQRTSNIDIPSRNHNNDRDRDPDPLGRMPRTNNDLGATASPPFTDCPLTPTNDSGPLAFDGRAGRL